MKMNNRRGYNSAQPLKTEPQGLQLPSLQAETTPSREPVFLMEAQNGMLVRVPQSKLESWQAAQNSGAAPGLTEVEQRLRDRIMQDLYGSKK